MFRTETKSTAKKGFRSDLTYGYDAIMPTVKLLQYSLRWQIVVFVGEPLRHECWVMALRKVLL